MTKPIYEAPVLLDLSGTAGHGAVTPDDGCADGSLPHIATDCYCRGGAAPDITDCRAGWHHSLPSCKAGSHAATACQSGQGQL